MKAYRSRKGVEIKTLSLYCLFLSIGFSCIIVLVDQPIQGLMISESRKIFGIICYSFALSFFAIFTFKTSHSILFLFPLIFSLVLISFPIFLLVQEPRHGFNRIFTANDSIQYCKTVSPSPPPPISPDKYVIFQPTDTGTGNRLLGLISSYTLALVTGRKLLINWRISSNYQAEFENLFQSPYILPLSNVTNNIPLSSSEYDFLNLPYCRQCSIRRRHPGFTTLLKENLTEYFKKKYIFVVSNVYFAPLIAANIYHRASICHEYNSSHIFSSTYHKILTLTPELQNSIDEQAAEFNGKYVIGIQIRIKDRVSFPISRVGQFFNCALNLGGHKNNTLYFVGSDSELIKSYAKEIFGDKLYTSKRLTHRFDKKGIEAAIIDLILLSKCNELISTPFSTFGAVAAGIGGIKPHIITRDDGYCFKDLSSEPKCHIWHTMGLSDSLPSHGSSDMLNQDESFL